MKSLNALSLKRVSVYYAVSSSVQLGFFKPAISLANSLFIALVLILALAP